MAAPDEDGTRKIDIALNLNNNNVHSHFASVMASYGTTDDSDTSTGAVSDKDTSLPSASFTSGSHTASNANASASICGSASAVGDSVQSLFDLFLSSPLPSASAPASTSALCSVLNSASDSSDYNNNNNATGVSGSGATDDGASPLDMMGYLDALDASVSATFSSTRAGASHGYPRQDQARVPQSSKPLVSFMTVEQQEQLQHQLLQQQERQRKAQEKAEKQKQQHLKQQQQHEQLQAQAQALPLRQRQRARQSPVSATAAATAAAAAAAAGETSRTLLSPQSMAVSQSLGSPCSLSLDSSYDFPVSTSQLDASDCEQDASTDRERDASGMRDDDDVDGDRECGEDSNDCGHGGAGNGFYLSPQNKDTSSQAVSAHMNKSSVQPHFQSQAPPHPLSTQSALRASRVALLSQSSSGATLLDVLQRRPTARAVALIAAYHAAAIEAAEAAVATAAAAVAQAGAKAETETGAGLVSNEEAKEASAAAVEAPAAAALSHSHTTTPAKMQSSSLSSSLLALEQARSNLAAARALRESDLATPPIDWTAATSTSVSRASCSSSSSRLTAASVASRHPASLAPLPASSLSAVRFLLSQGADPNHRDADGASPLWVALHHPGPAAAAAAALLLREIGRAHV